MKDPEPEAPSARAPKPARQRAQVESDPGPRLDVGASRARPNVHERGSLDEFEQAGDGPTHGARLGLGLLLLAVALVGGYLVVGRQSARHMVGLPSEDAIGAPQQPAPAPAPARRRYGELRVNSVPERAQVLLRVGSGPVLVSKLPVGIAHEFVAVQPGFLPSRAVVPADAQWQVEAGEPRYELALQLNPVGAQRAHQDDLGATRLTQAMGKPSGASGNVRVVTSPPGAGVYQLIGFTPQVAVQDLPVDQPLDLLVFLPGSALQRIAIGASDWKQNGNALVADVTVTLKPAR